MTPRRLTIAILLLVPGMASAHAILVASTPDPGGRLAPGHEAITLRYNSKVDSRRSVLTLVAGDGTDSRLPITPGPTPDVLTTTAQLAPGSYTLRWQVLAVDGHLTRGDVPFTVSAP